MMKGRGRLSAALFTILLVTALVLPVTASVAAPVHRDTCGASIAAPSAGDQFVPMSTTYVYITRTGSKYHRKSCRYLRYSKKRVTLKYAKSHHYGRCKICKPPR